jgi:hypothetical protein
MAGFGGFGGSVAIPGGPTIGLSGGTVSGSYGGVSLSVPVAGGGGAPSGAPSGARGTIVCPGSPSLESVRMMLDRAPSTRLNELRVAWSKTSDGVKGRAMPTDPAVLTLHAMGGTDCQASTATGQAFQRKFFDLLSEYGGGGTVPVPAATVPIQDAQVRTDEYGVHWQFDPLRKAWEVIRELPGRVLEGAVQGATGAAASGATQAAQPILAARSRQALANALPLVLVGFLVATFLRK